MRPSLDLRGISSYRLIDEVGEETRAHPVCIINKRWLRSQEVANWRLDWRQHRGGQCTENDRVDSGRPTAEEERSVGHDRQNRAPVAQRRFDNVLMRVARDALLPEHLLDAPAHKAADQ